MKNIKQAEKEMKYLGDCVRVLGREVRGENNPATKRAMNDRLAILTRDAISAEKKFLSLVSLYGSSRLH